MPKFYIIYHEVKPGIACPDGIAAAWVTHKYLTEKYPDATINLVGRCYNDDREWPTFDDDYRTIYCVDFSDPYLNNFKGVCTIDHHKSALAKNLKQLIYDVEECGATLCWKYFYPNNPTHGMPTFLQYVRDRDLWIKELPYTEEIHLAVGKRGRTFETFDDLNKRGITRELIGEGQILLLERNEKVKQLAETFELQSIGNVYYIPTVILNDEDSKYTSDVCHYLLENTDTSIAAAIVDGKTVSIRSINGEARQLAEEMGTITQRDIHYEP